MFAEYKNGNCMYDIQGNQKCQRKLENFFNKDKNICKKCIPDSNSGKCMASEAYEDDPFAKGDCLYECKYDRKVDKCVNK